MANPKGAVRTFSSEFKRKVLERIAGGETIAALSAALEYGDIVNTAT